VDYLVLYADLSGLSDAEADAFADAAAGLGLDVDDLSPRMAVSVEVTVLLSTALAALCGKLAEGFGGDAGEKLWDLLKRLFHGRSGAQAIEDRQQRITFVWDERARRDGAAAAAAMVRIGKAIGAIPDGTALSWDPDRKQWHYRN
jgi:hypothetical protein